MRIESIATSFPDRIVDTAEVLEIIRRFSEPGFSGDLEQTLRTIGTLVRRSGIEKRRWLAPDDTGFAHVETAISQVLNEAEIKAQDVDLLIYASVDRQVREPGHSFFIAKALDMNETQCFDVLEACASFGRATIIAQALLNTHQANRVLIVTSEFNVHEGGWGHCNHQLKSPDDLPWAFSAFTIGEAATATLLVRGGEDWLFDIESRPEFADLCMSPIADVQSVTTATIGDTSILGKGGSRFVSYGLEMEIPGKPLIIEIIDRHQDWIGQSRILLPHTHTQRTWLEVAKCFENGNTWPFFFICNEFGNLVSSSIPAALTLAKENGAIERGDRVTALMTAAGFSFGAYTFRL